MTYLHSRKATIIIAIIAILITIVAIPAIEKAMTPHKCTSCSPVVLVKPQKPQSSYNIDENIVKEHLQRLGKIVVLDDNGVVFRASQKALGKYGISVESVRIPRLDNSCPAIIIINLLNSNKSLSEETINKLSSCLRSGSHIFIVYNNTTLACKTMIKLLKSLQKSSNYHVAAFACPHSNYITVTKTWRNGNVEYTTIKFIRVDGLVFKEIGNRLIPIQAGSSIAYEKITNLEDLVSNAIDGAFKNMIKSEIELSQTR